VGVAAGRGLGAGGGYVDESEDRAATAAREVEEETGWRPRPYWLSSGRSVPVISRIMSTSG
jgi:8-oxo-dGTP pyrophosphatase MutT (NUDIX family)